MACKSLTKESYRRIFCNISKRTPIVGMGNILKWLSHFFEKLIHQRQGILLPII